MKIHELTREDIAALLPPRKRDCSKRDNGKALLIAGSPGFSGAAAMAGASALRAGAGTLKIVVPRSIAGALYALPEAMWIAYPADDWDGGAASFLGGYLSDATAAAIGPGLGRGEGREALLMSVLGSRKPTVVDADGLFALAGLADKRAALHKNVVLTPHLGEMARLTGLAAGEIASSMERVALEYAREWGCTVLLKGAKSVIAGSDGRLALNTTGNAGLAKGGSGDVLSGIALAMLSQGLEPFGAACAASYILGASAETALTLLQNRMLMARDVTEAIALTIKENAREDKL